MTALLLQSIIARDDGPIAAKLDDEVVMLSSRAQAYFGLGDIGSRIWAMLDEPRRVADIRDELKGADDVDQTTGEQEAFALLFELLQAPLIRTVGELTP